ncbi:hypothetical protein L2E82_29017 [Cichorium intybus]|uniref:Uncharacterized protein n=1 Tax=Cichorium intybus TaxID=13427 RepID=A0ACB9CWX6_CICIN|nr:hypothetical protein L2E82_29017 [Cichorium intybus]
MPERDVVSWNSIISGYSSSGLHNCALHLFSKMQTFNVIPSEYTYSIVLSFVQSLHHGMEIHCNMIRNGVNFSSVIIGNSLISMYSNHGFMNYAFDVFISMEQIDIISWNTLIAGFSKSGHKEIAYNLFNTMRTTTNYLPDAFTISSILTICSTIQDLSTGKQIFSLSIKLGFISNTILSSAIIDMFSNCKSIHDSIRVFEEIDTWDSSVCNSMISTLVKHKLEENAMDIFTLSLKRNIKPTEFTLSCLVSCSSLFLPPVHGTQLHCLVIKLGFEFDSIVSSSLSNIGGTMKIPGLPLLRYSEIPSFLLPTDALAAVFQEPITNLEKHPNSFVLLNTFDGLEEESIESIHRHINIFSVGPLVSRETEEPFKCDSFQDSDRETYLRWLDSKPE